MAKMISGCMPQTRSGPPVLRILDIHAPVERYIYVCKLLIGRFYFNNNVTVRLQSVVHLALSQMDKFKDNFCIAFPDDGAYKRFRHQVDNYPIIVCSKVTLYVAR
jgi:hypothetical protein